MTRPRPPRGNAGLDKKDEEDKDKKNEGQEGQQKIIESAIIFWFKDDDYTSGFKLWDYFNE